MTNDTVGAPIIAGLEYEAVLGSGGFSDVFLYRQKLPRRKVAVKVLKITALDASARRQFVAEANLMAQLSSHPSIATIFNADISEDGRPYFVMEYCSGGNLATRYKREPLPVAEVLKIGIRMASALHAAHQLGIVHRDIKPANILLTDYGSPVLTDFGISVGEDDGVAEATMLRDFHFTVTTGSSTGSAGLSIPWAPPEAFDEVPNLDARSDLYSLGATLYTLLHGNSPFEKSEGSNGTLHIIRRIERGEITPLTRTDVPESLVKILHKAMSPSPQDRYQNTLELAHQLSGIELEIGAPNTPLELQATVAPEHHEPEVIHTGKPELDPTVQVRDKQPRVPDATIQVRKKQPEALDPSDIDTKPRYQLPPVELTPKQRRKLIKPIAIGAAVLAVISGLIAIPLVASFQTPSCGSRFVKEIASSRDLQSDYSGLIPYSEQALNSLFEPKILETGLQPLCGQTIFGTAQFAVFPNEDTEIYKLQNLLSENYSCSPLSTFPKRLYVDCSDGRHLIRLINGYELRFNFIARNPIDNSLEPLDPFFIALLYTADGAPW